MDNYTAKLLIELYRDRLRTEADAKAASTLHKLLIEELDRLGFDYEQLEKIEGEIADGRSRVERQLSLIDELETNGHDANSAKAILSNLCKTLLIYEQYRRTWVGVMKARNTY
jgi:hypothetical protein